MIDYQGDLVKALITGVIGLLFGVILTEINHYFARSLKLEEWKRQEAKERLAKKNELFLQHRFVMLTRTVDTKINQFTNDMSVQLARIDERLSALERIIRR